MKTIVAVYTGQGLSSSLQAVFKEELPDCRLINLIDDSIIHDVIKEGKVSKKITKRLLQYYRIAEEMGADIILNTCSSVGEVADLSKFIIEKPIVRIDEAMALEAVSKYEKIGIIATLPTTLNPTSRLIKSQADKLRKNISISEGLADGAYHALISGRLEEHDNLIVKAAEKLADEVDCIVLAQGSMMRMEEQLAEITHKIVLSSPRLCAKYIKSTC